MGMSQKRSLNISNPYVGERRPGSVGFPLPGVSARIDEATGEIHLKGSNVFAGYWKRPDATQAAFVDGWFKTGDIAERSSDGYYTLCGRRSDLIISGGFNIYPREIEGVFGCEQPEVAEAAVVGEKHALRGGNSGGLLSASGRGCYRSSCGAMPGEARVVQSAAAI